MFARVSVLFLVSLLPATGASFSDLYFFGDSLTDTGNIYGATTALSAVTFGLVPVQPLSPPYYNGRFSDGPVWAETTAALLGQAEDAGRASMSLGPFGVLPGAGNNYAIGGARTGYGGALGIFDAFVPTGVLAQVDFYLQESGTASPTALYFLSGGGNDLRDATQIADTNARIAAANAAADYLAYSIYKLYLNGARNFMLVNGPNIGFVPETIALGKINEGFEAAAYFNFRLAGWAYYFNQTPDMQIGLFDLFTFSSEVFFDTLLGGQQYGFTEALIPCKPGTPGASSCATSLFFDDIHPTASLHALVGTRIADQIAQEWAGFGEPAVLSRAFAAVAEVEQVPEPATVGLVCIALIGCGVARRRRAA